MNKKTKFYLRKLALVNVIKKKQRTRLSVLSVLLSTVIIYTSLTLFFNVSQFSNTVNYQSLGNFHYAYTCQEELNFPNRFKATKDYDTGYYFIYQQQQINLRSLEVSEDIVPFELVGGTYPKNENEILISDDFDIHLNDIVHLNDVYNFKVVGIYKTTDILNSINDECTYFYTKWKPSVSTTYYIKDQQIHTTTAFEDFTKIMNLSGNDIISHTQMISNDTIRVYMEDSILILSIFILVIFLGIFMSSISIHNVILISDESRKKELGLLKSVGANSKMVCYLLKTELFILGVNGSLLGIVCGIGLSSWVLSLFIHRFYLKFSFHMVFHPLYMVVSIIVGCLLIFLSGMNAYKKYIHSIVVDDLKDVPYAYAKPVIEKSTRKQDASWNLFLIYNARMKEQTKNIRHSFILLLLTAILFSSVALSNLVYKNTYTHQEYDFIIKKNFDANEINLDFVNGMYDLVEDEEIIVKDYVINRLSSQMMIAQFEMFLNPETKNFKLLLDKNVAIAKDMDGLQWTNLYMYTTWFDQHQLDILEPYIVEGSYDDLIQYILGTENDSRQIETFIAVLVEGEGASLCGNFHVNDIVRTYPLNLNGFTKNISLSSTRTDPNAVLGVVMVIPKEDVQKVSEAIHIPLDVYPYLAARSYEIISLEPTDNKVFYFQGNEILEIKLKNPALHNQFQNKLDELMLKTGVGNDYTYINYPAMQETMAFSTFIVEILLYPLFFMLFFVAILNMNNVFNGNIQLKRNDMSIMKSVGIKYKELRKMFVFEYLEGYINAAFMITLLCMLVVLVMKYITIDMVIDQGNILGALVMATLLIGPIIAVPIVFLTIRKVKSILPIGDTRSME